MFVEYYDDGDDGDGAQRPVDYNGVKKSRISRVFYCDPTSRSISINGLAWLSMCVVVVETAESRCERDLSRKFVFIKLAFRFFVSRIDLLASYQQRQIYIVLFLRLVQNEIMQIGWIATSLRASEREREGDGVFNLLVFSLYDTHIRPRSDKNFDWTICVAACARHTMTATVRKTARPLDCRLRLIGGDCRASRKRNSAYVQSAMLIHSSASLSHIRWLLFFLFSRFTRIWSKSYTYLERTHTPL